MKSLPFMLFVAMFSIFAPRAAGAEDTLKKIEAAWLKRQEATKSFVFEFNENCQLRKELLDFGSQETDDRAKQSRIPIPRHHKFTIDGERLSYRMDVLDFRIRKQFSQPLGYHETFNGKSSQHYTGDGDENDMSVGSAIITAKPHEFAVMEISLRPLILLYRPVHPTIGKIDLAKHRIEQEQEIIDGISCLIVKQADGEQIQATYWVDPERDYIPLRYVSGVDGQERNRIDIQYRRTEDGWIPISWHLNRYNTVGDLMTIADASVVSFELNSKIEDSEFDIRPKPGTVVDDRVTGKEYVQKRNDDQ